MQWFGVRLRRAVTALPLVGCCVLSGFTATATASASATARLPSVRALGALPGGTSLKVTIALEPRDPAALAAYAAAVSDPASPEYHQYLTVAEFAERFGATPATISAVTSALRARGLAPQPAAPNGLSLGVDADAGTLAQALSTSFEKVSVAGRTGYLNLSAPELGAVASDVQGVIGLDDVTAPQPLDTPAEGTPMPCTGASTAVAEPRNIGALTSDQVASIYGFDGVYSSGNLGAGQTVAVYELESNIPSDITAFQTCYGLTSDISYQTVDGGGGPAGSGDGTETELDVENVTALAPAANVIVYQGPNSGSGPYDTYAAIISGDHAHVISTSWGECEAELGASAAQAEFTLFEEAAVQGETVVAASGDNGSEDCYAPGDAGSSTAAAVDDPASQPYVTGVGGTSVTTLSPLTESVWNNGSGASGGGDSSDWPMPTFQTDAASSLGVTDSASSATTCAAAAGECRQVPDVAADADPDTGYLVYYNGDGSPDDDFAWQTDGGTSGGAPVWAALFALADAACGTPIGFANPVLYGAAGTSAYASEFHDVTAGTNDWVALGGADDARFAAKAGYDQTTGLGTPNASALIPALCGGPVSITTPDAQTGISGKPVAFQLTATAASGAVAFGAAGLPPGLSLDPGSGVISGTPTATGQFSVTVSASTAQQSVQTTFTWTISTATVTLVPAAGQFGALGKATSLALQASDNNGAAITYSATGLPPGLALDPSTGVISGVPSAAGTPLVVVQASAAGATTMQETFQWQIAGPPGLGRGSLTGVGVGKPLLTVALTAGVDAPALREVSFTAPHGLSFVTAQQALSRGIAFSGRQPFSASLSRGRLNIVLRVDTTSTTLTLRPPALKALVTLQRKVRRHQGPRRTVNLRVTDANGAMTVLPLVVKAT